MRDSEVRGAGIGDGNGLRVGGTNGDVREAEAGGHHGNGRLHTGAAERNGGRTGGGANDADGATPGPHAGRCEVNRKGKALTRGKSHGAEKTADGEARAGDGNLGNTDAASAGVGERQRLRAGSADQGVAETQACGARGEEIGRRSGGEASDSSAGDADVENVATAMKVCGEGDDAVEVGGRVRREHHLEGGTAVRAEVKRQSGAGDDEFRKTSGNLKDGERLAIVAHDDGGT